ncbi:MAG: 4Fe-4S binding protein [Clostridia bacterium]|nr:4Fe-4S binding protein [Clostridia bacterium]
MDNDSIKTIAYEAGFAAAYFLPLPDYPAHDDEPHIVWSAEGYPWARASLLLVWAYRPYKKGERIPAYYINSNLSYHASVALKKRLEAEGINALRCEIPIKQMAVRYGIARSLKSSLIEIPPFGTRTVIQTMLLGEPFTPEEYSITDDGLCSSCRACENACPARAISACGYDVKKCMRFYMDGADYPEWVYGIQRTHLGCEVCQEVCPRNAALGFDEPSPEVREAFDLGRLAGGDTSAARKLVGKNITGNGKLQKEAQHFLKNPANEQNIP